MAMNEAELNDDCLQQTEMEANRIRELSDTGRAIFNIQNSKNQINYRHNQGHRDIDESFDQYISDFTDYVKIPSENHPFFQVHQQQFRNEIAKF